MTGLHESTLALSVYNAIQRRGSMDRAQVLRTLQTGWDSSVDANEVDQGAEYLLSRQLLTDAGGVLVAARLDNGAAATVIRHPLRQTDLVFAVPR